MSDLVQWISEIELSSGTKEEADAAYQRIVQRRLSASLNAADYDSVGFTMLHHAIIAQRALHELDDLIDVQRVDVNAKSLQTTIYDAYDLTPLFAAIMRSDVVRVKYLLARKADPMLLATFRITYSLGGDQWRVPQTAFHYAASLRTEEKNALVKLLEGSTAAALSSRLDTLSDEKGKACPLLRSPKGWCSEKQWRIEQVRAAIEALARCLSSREQDDAVVHAALRNLSETHPAVQCHLVRRVYQACLAARDPSQNQPLQPQHPWWSCWEWCSGWLNNFDFSCV